MARFGDFKQERQGVWPPHRYSGTIIDEYESTGNDGVFTMKTEDRPAQNDPESRNLRICARIHNNGQVRDFAYIINYRLVALTTERQDELREAQKAYKSVRGAWPDKLAQRDSLSLSRLHEVERAGITLEDNPTGGFVTDHMVGRNINFYVGVEKKVGEGQAKERVKVTPQEYKSTPEEERQGWYNVIKGINESVE